MIIDFNSLSDEEKDEISPVRKVFVIKNSKTGDVLCPIRRGEFKNIWANPSNFAELKVAGPLMYVEEKYAISAINEGLANLSKTVTTGSLKGWVRCGYPDMLDAVVEKGFSLGRRGR